MAPRGWWRRWPGQRKPSVHMDGDRHGLEDGRQLGGFDLQDLPVVYLAGRGQHLLVNSPRPVGVGGGFGVTVVADVVDAEVVVVRQVQGLSGIGGGDAL